jgi:hypothetical protein
MKCPTIFAGFTHAYAKKTNSAQLIKELLGIKQ